MKTNGIKNGRVIFLKTCQELQPSTLAASKGSFGIPKRPANKRIANTEVLDHISAAIIEMLAKTPSTNHGIGCMTPNSLKKFEVETLLEKLKFKNLIHH